MMTNQELIKYINESIKIDIDAGKNNKNDPIILNFLSGRISANREILYRLEALTARQYYLDYTDWIQVG